MSGYEHCYIYCGTTAVRALPAAGTHDTPYAAAVASVIIV